jgi:hypothetical protein
VAEQQHALEGQPQPSACVQRIQLAAATRIRPPVAGVVSLSGPASFQGVDAAVERLRVRCCSSPRRRRSGPRRRQGALYRRARGADKQLLIVPGGGHGSSMLESATAAPRVRAAVRRFVADHARP